MYFYLKVNMKQSENFTRVHHCQSYKLSARSTSGGQDGSLTLLCALDPLTRGWDSILSEG